MRAAPRMAVVTDPMDPAAAEPAPPPATGVAEIDAALARLSLDGPVGEHHEQLSAAVEVLQRALRTPQQ